MLMSVRARSSRARFILPEVAAMASRGSRESFGLRRDPRWLPEGASASRSGDTPTHLTRRNVFHTASPAVELPLVNVSCERLVTGSGSQYTHCPWSLQRRALICPLRRRLLIVPRSIPSLAETC